MGENKKRTENVKKIIKGIKNVHEAENEVKNETVRETPPPMPTIDEEEPSKYKIAENGEIVR